MAVLKIQIIRQLKILHFSHSLVRVSHHWVSDPISAECKHENENLIRMQYLIYKLLLKTKTAPQGGRIIRIWALTACRDSCQLLIPIFIYPCFISRLSSNEHNQLLHLSFFLSFFLSFANSTNSSFSHEQSPNQPISTLMLIYKLYFFDLKAQKPKAKPHNIQFQ